MSEVKVWSVVDICDLFQRFKSVPEWFVNAADYNALQKHVTPPAVWSREKPTEPG